MAEGKDDVIVKSRSKRAQKKDPGANVSLS